MSQTIPQPLEIRVHASRQTLTLVYPEDQIVEFSAEFLRVYSPSAEVQGHHPDQKKTVSGKRDVKIIKLEPVGNYAIRIHFDDLHMTGIFSWTYFHEMAEKKDALWQAYLTELADKKLSRD